MSETSTSFYYWQLAPSWRLVPWLANPGNPPMSPHAGRTKTGTHCTHKTVERKGGETATKESPHSGKMLKLRKTLTKTPTKPLQCPMNQEHGECWCMRISNKLLTARVKLVLLVVNSVKLHLTAYFGYFHP